METLADLAVRQEADVDRTALVSVPSGREYDYRRLRSDARRTANALAFRGVRSGRTLGVADDPVPETVLSVLAAGLLGAVVRVDPSGDADARAVVVPTGRAGEYDLPPGGQRIGYGDAPEDPNVGHFEEEVWSENPTFPPPSVDPGDPLLATDDRTVSHGAVLAAADGLGAGLSADDRVAIRAPLSDPGTIASIAAALSTGATVLLPDPDDPAAAIGSVAVATGDAPESRTVAPPDLR